MAADPWLLLYHVTAWCLAKYFEFGMTHLPLDSPRSVRASARAYRRAYDRARSRVPLHRAPPFALILLCSLYTSYSADDTTCFELWYSLAFKMTGSQQA